MATTVFRFDLGYNANCFIICYSIKFKIMMLLMSQIFLKSIIICVIVSASNIYKEGIEMISY